MNHRAIALAVTNLAERTVVFRISLRSEVRALARFAANVAALAFARTSAVTAHLVDAETADALVATQTRTTQILFLLAGTAVAPETGDAVRIHTTTGQTRIGTTDIRVAFFSFDRAANTQTVTGS